MLKKNKRQTYANIASLHHQLLILWMADSLPFPFYYYNFVLLLPLLFLVMWSGRCFTDDARTDGDTRYAVMAFQFKIS